MKLICVRSLLWTIVLAAVFAPRVWAIDFTLTMNDLPNQPVNGLIHPSGVQFGFTVNGVANNDAHYAATGPGPITFVQDPSIEGPSNGVLSMTFPLPTPVLRFGVARLSLESTTAAVELFNAANVSLGITNMTLTPMPMFAEGQFNYSGPAVKRATIRFVEPESRFAFDNLFFRVIPEPATWFVACSAGLTWLAGGNFRLRVSRYVDS